VTQQLDYLADPLPPGYKRWQRSRCSAACNYEAMSWCDGDDDCPFAIEKPESNNGVFAFIVKIHVQ
jgi:hypothetical protein